MVVLPSDLPVVERDIVRVIVQDVRGEILLFPSSASIRAGSPSFSPIYSSVTVDEPFELWS